LPTSKGWGEIREGEKGRKRGTGGEGGKDDLHPTLFLGPAAARHRTRIG